MSCHFNFSYCTTCSNDQREQLLADSCTQYIAYNTTMKTDTTSVGKVWFPHALPPYDGRYRAPAQPGNEPIYSATPRLPITWLAFILLSLRVFVSFTTVFMVCLWLVLNLARMRAHQPYKWGLDVGCPSVVSQPGRWVVRVLFVRYGLHLKTTSPIAPSPKVPCELNAS